MHASLIQQLCHSSQFILRGFSTSTWGAHQSRFLSILYVYTVGICGYSGWQSLVALYWTGRCTTDRPTAFSKQKLKLVGTSFGLLAIAISLTFFLWYREKIPLNYYENNSFCGRKAHPQRCQAFITVACMAYPGKTSTSAS